MKFPWSTHLICHCRTKEQAIQLKEALEERFKQCGLKLHPEKTKIVYCKDGRRQGNNPQEKFDFLGFTFRPRLSKSRWGKYFLSFSPAVSNKSSKKMSQRIRNWKLHRRSDKSLVDLARMFNPVIRGWINYYGSYYKSALYPIFQRLDLFLARWAEQKYKKLREHSRRARQWVRRFKKRESGLFAHWKMLPSTV